jgi:hypothetical protein
MRIKIENVIWQFAKAFRKKCVADHPGLEISMSAGLCGDQAQEPRLRISGGDHPTPYSAPRHAAAESALETGVTRGKRLVVLVGQKKAVAIAVRNVSSRRRWSKLTDWLRPGSPALRKIRVAS